MWRHGAGVPLLTCTALETPAVATEGAVLAVLRPQQFLVSSYRIRLRREAPKVQKEERRPLLP